ncbi:MDR family MFS transporter [Nonomuraea fastidiosa]|jgi:EmrB/QacA subfamily drug resistance transporter|uniref:MDR family MFS transporter n=1 Tax=Nonomuraea TaxID=83681 RepID=UPI0034405B82
MPEEAARQAGPSRVDGRLLRVGLILQLGALAPLLDTTIVSVAIPDLGRAFGAPVSAIQLVSTGYLLAFAMVVPLVGWAIERYGGRAVWTASLLAFLAGSLLCGVAWSLPVLVAARVVQGAAGGMVFPVMQTVLAQVAGERRLGRAMAILAVPGQFAPIAGPTLGGVLVATLGWRWIFLVNLPICLIALVAGHRGLPRGTRDAGRRLDVTGLVLLAPAMALLVYGLTRVGEVPGGPDAQAVACAGAGIALLLAFSARALRRPASLVNVRLLRARSLASASAVVFCTQAALLGTMFVLPLFYERLHGADALRAGLLLAPQGIGAMLAMPLVGLLVDRIGPRPLVLAGIVLAIAGTLPFALAGPATGQAALALALGVRGLGLGAAVIPVVSAAYYGVAERDYPGATTVFNIVQRLGGSFGTAVLAVVLQWRLTGPGGVAGAYAVTFWWAIGFTVLTLVPALFMVGRHRTE